MPTVRDLNGPSGRLNPGNCGKSASFFFVNTSPIPICDLNIKTYDEDLSFIWAPDIVSDGVKISKFDPIKLPNGDTGVSNETPVPKEGWNRSHNDEDSSETKINFEPGNCIQPGKGFVLNLTFDQELDGDEGIVVSPSRLYDNEHYGIGALLPEVEKRVDELAAAPQGTVPFGKTIGKAIRAADAATAMALRHCVRREYYRTAVNRAQDLPISAIPGISPEKQELFASLGMARIRDIFEDPDLQRAVFLYTLGRGTTR
jgi:hypothetical protein